MEFSVCPGITECIYLHNNKINKGREDIFHPTGFTDDFILPVTYLANLTKGPSSWGRVCLK